MAISSFASAVAVQKTDEAGEIVFSEYKGSTDIVIPASKLSAGTYFLTTAATGTLTFYSYTGTTVGDKITEASGNGTRSTIEITIPSGKTGVFISGSYIGSLIFQKMTKSTAVASKSQTFAKNKEIFEYGNGDAWLPTFGNDSYLGERAAYPRVVDYATRSIATSSTAVYGSNGNGAARTFATNGSVIICTSGYHGSSVDAGLYYSTNGGTSYTLAKWIPGIDYNNISMYYNGTFVVASYQNGYGQPSYNYHTSTDGINWTQRSFPGNLGGNVQIRYVNNLWFRFSSSSQELWSSPDAITWTQRSNIPSSGIYQFGYSNGAYVYGYSSDWRKSTDLSSWTQIASSNYNTWASFANNSPDVMAYVENYQNSGYSIFSGTDQNGYRMFFTFDGNYMNNWYIGFPSYYSRLTYPVTFGGQLYAYVQDSPYKMYKIAGAFGGAAGHVSGAPTTVMSGSNDQIFFSKTVNRWMLISGNRPHSAAQGGSAFPLTWTEIASISAYKFIDTGKSVGFVGSDGNYWRSTDGINWETYTINNSPAANQGIGYYNGVLAITSSNRETIIWSVDDGKTWTTIGVATGSAESFYLNSTSSGLFARASSTGKYFKSTDGIIWTQYGSGSGTPRLHTANDCIISWGGANTWYRTLPGGLGWLQFSTPVQYGNGGSVVQFGTQFAYMPYTVGYTSFNQYYVSDNCVTWTAKTGVTNLQWYCAAGSDAYLLIGGPAQIDVHKVTTSITI